MTSLKPPKSIAITWSIRTSVKHSTVCTASGRPPQANAALILAAGVAAVARSAFSGIGTYRSRGIETRYALSWLAGMCMTMIVSARHSLALSSGASGSRESLPSSRMLSAPSTVFAGRPPVIAGERVGAVEVVVRGSLA